MKRTDVLVVGSGGREHALAWKLAKSSRVGRIFAAPGNPGTAALGTNVPLDAGDRAGLAAFARQEKIGLTVIGPDQALADGLADEFAAAGLPVFGPNAAAARLESSKSFAKDFMRRHGIPTADFRIFDEAQAALDHLAFAEFPLVVKADGLALGKGVTVAPDRATAASAVREIMLEGRFGRAGRRVVIEECLAGVECSIHALVDGRSWVQLPDARDHKRLGAGDTGPNTGGMGTVSPSGRVDEAMRGRIEREILDPFLEGLQADGIDFCGMLFPGLMLTADGPQVLEFNVRWGDPETQVLVARLENDLLDLLESCVAGDLAGLRPSCAAGAACCVILAAEGYPSRSRTGDVITGLAEAERDGTVVFHAGTAWQDGRLVTAGGRVLGVTATGPDLPEARAAAYAAADRIHFHGAHYRRDLGL